MLTDPHRPTIMGIVGASAAGKTTLSSGIADIIGQDKVSIICADDYHRYDRLERIDRGLGPADPQNNYLEILEQHVWLLRNGKPILKPVYDHSRGVLGPAELIEPKPYIVVEGLLCYATRVLRDCYDVKLYLEPDERLREFWKLERDTQLRGYSIEEARENLKRGKDDAKRFVQPQRVFADIVISFYPPEGRSEETGANLGVRHILRPTLPHPDITPLLEPTVTNGVSLELSRDRDGKPVDVLDIMGEIAMRDAKRMEDLIWHLLPETSEVRANFGEIRAGRGDAIISHPLALTELMIAYHLETAAAENRRSARRMQT